MNPKRKRRLSQQDLRLLGVRPGLLSTRYPAGGDRAEVRRLNPETSGRPPVFSNRFSNEGREDG
jgi:hypothetical protein